MKYFHLILLGLILIIADLTNAQHLYFGIRDGINFISINQNNKKNLNVDPGSIYCLIGAGILKNCNLEFRTGYNFGISTDYRGPEFGLYLRQEILYNKLFILGGINAHINIPDNNSNVSKTITLLGIGVGSDFGKSIVIELTYYFPLEKSFILFSPPGDEPTLTNIIQLGLGINLGFIRK